MMKKIFVALFAVAVFVASAAQANAAKLHFAEAFEIEAGSSTAFFFTAEIQSKLKPEMTAYDLLALADSETSCTLFLVNDEGASFKELEIESEAPAKLSYNGGIEFKFKSGPARSMICHKAKGEFTKADLLEIFPGLQIQ